MSDKKEQKPEFVICGPSIDGTRKAAIRISEDTVSIGTIAPMNAYEPGAELIEARQLGNSPVLEITASSRNGPAQVSNENFRRGWDNIFGNKQPIAQA